MSHAMRPSTLQSLGLGTVLGIFQKGRLPARTEALVERVFGPEADRGVMVVSGAGGIVGAGKVMQFASRLEPFGVKVAALDFPGAPDGVGRHYPGLERSFGRERAGRIMANVVRLHYDGRELPPLLADLKPRFLLEAIPEILEVKRSHYRLFRQAFPGIEIRSVTSGFPASQLGVPVAHPAFPHEINKVFEVVEPSPSDLTRLFWALGLQPVPAGDHWSFVLDVLFCGLTLAAARYHRASNMPYWKIDKHVRRLLGPNPFRAHDAIGTAGATFLTWSCLHHLDQRYGPLFEPAPELTYRKESGESWYPPDHFRPVVDWRLDAAEEEELRVRILGPLFQMTALMLREKRAALPCVNIVGELCAQFRRGILAVARSLGPDEVVRTVEAYHGLEPRAAESPWAPEGFENMDDPSWSQLYVNAEHNGRYGVVALAREAYNGDVDAELNRAMDWLKASGVESVILSGDFHLATQLIGADTAEFHPALDDAARGLKICKDWSRTARRLHEEFRTSVGVVCGKRCLGGMLELMLHCHYLVAVEDAELGMPEVALPVLPGMEGCHWPFRKCKPEDWPKLLNLLLDGRPVKAREAQGWLVDFCGPVESVLETAGKIAGDGDHGVARRPVETGALGDIPLDGIRPPAWESEDAAFVRKAFVDCIRGSCGATLAEALEIQALHGAAFMTSKACRRGRIGVEGRRVMEV